MDRDFIKRFVSCLTLVAFLTSSTPGVRQVYAQTQVPMPVPGTMVSLSQPSAPAVLKGMKVYPQDPFRFDFIVDQGSREASPVRHHPSKEMGTSGASTSDDLKAESTKLIRYFLASLTTPEDEIWVNLSPYEGDRIVPEAFGQTEMGRDLLAQDYILKQITSSIIYPEGEAGKAFWAKVYKAFQEKYGSTDFPVDTFNKVWITPDEATVYVNGNTAVIKSSHLKVMLESDYVAANQRTERVGGEVPDPVNPALEAQSHANVGEGLKPSPTGELTKQVLREVVIPILEKEVNEGANFSALRQIYQAMILATWFKRNLKDTVVGRAYMDQNKVKGIDLAGKDEKTEIWKQYVEAFKKGAFNYIKEETDELTGEIIPRKYFSGGFEGFKKGKDINQVPASVREMADQVTPAMNVASVRLTDPAMQISGPDRAMDVRSAAQERLTEEWKLLDGHVQRLNNPARAFSFGGKTYRLAARMTDKGEVAVDIMREEEGTGRLEGAKEGRDPRRKTKEPKVWHKVFFYVPTQEGIRDVGLYLDGAPDGFPREKLSKVTGFWVWITRQLVSMLPAGGRFESEIENEDVRKTLVSCLALDDGELYFTYPRDLKKPLKDRKSFRVVDGEPASDQEIRAEDVFLATPFGRLHRSLLGLEDVHLEYFVDGEMRRGVAVLKLLKERAINRELMKKEGFTVPAIKPYLVARKKGAAAANQAMKTEDGDQAILKIDGIEEPVSKARWFRMAREMEEREDWEGLDKLLTAVEKRARQEDFSAEEGQEWIGMYRRSNVETWRNSIGRYYFSGKPQRKKDFRLVQPVIEQLAADLTPDYEGAGIGKQFASDLERARQKFAGSRAAMEENTALALDSVFAGLHEYFKMSWSSKELSPATKRSLYTLQTLLSEFGYFFHLEQDENRVLVPIIGPIITSHSIGQDSTLVIHVDNQVHVKSGLRGFQVGGKVIVIRDREVIKDLQQELQDVQDRMSRGVPLTRRERFLALSFEGVDGNNENDLADAYYQGVDIHETRHYRDGNVRFRASGWRDDYKNRLLAASLHESKWGWAQGDFIDAVSKEMMSYLSDLALNPGAYLSLDDRMEKSTVFVANAIAQDVEMFEEHDVASGQIMDLLLEYVYRKTGDERFHVSLLGLSDAQEVEALAEQLSREFDPKTGRLNRQDLTIFGELTALKLFGRTLFIGDHTSDTVKTFRSPAEASYFIADKDPSAVKVYVVTDKNPITGGNKTLNSSSVGEIIEIPRLEGLQTEMILYPTQEGTRFILPNQEKEWKIVVVVRGDQGGQAGIPKTAANQAMKTEAPDPKADVAFVEKVIRDAKFVPGDLIRVASADGDIYTGIFLRVGYDHEQNTARIALANQTDDFWETPTWVPVDVRSLEQGGRLDIAKVPSDELNVRSDFDLKDSDNITTHASNLYVLMAALRQTGGIQLRPSEDVEAVLSGESRGTIVWNQKFVSTFPLKAPRSNLWRQLERYLSLSTKAAIRLSDVVKMTVYLAGVLKQARAEGDTGLIDEVGRQQKALNRAGIKLLRLLSRGEYGTYVKLSSIPVVFAGEGLWKLRVDIGVKGEVGYKRVNIRIVAVPREHVELTKNMLREKGQDIVVLDQDTAKELFRKHAESAVVGRAKDSDLVKMVMEQQGAGSKGRAPGLSASEEKANPAMKTADMAHPAMKQAMQSAYGEAMKTPGDLGAELFESAIFGGDDQQNVFPLQSRPALKTYFVYMISKAVAGVAPSMAVYSIIAVPLMVHLGMTAGAVVAIIMACFTGTQVIGYVNNHLFNEVPMAEYTTIVPGRDKNSLEFHINKNLGGLIRQGKNSYYLIIRDLILSFHDLLENWDRQNLNGVTYISAKSPLLITTKKINGKQQEVFSPLLEGLLRKLGAIHINVVSSPASNLYAWLTLKFFTPLYYGVLSDVPLKKSVGEFGFSLSGVERRRLLDKLRPIVESLEVLEKDDYRGMRRIFTQILEADQATPAMQTPGTGKLVVTSPLGRRVLSAWALALGAFVQPTQTFAEGSSQKIWKPVRIVERRLERPVVTAPHRTMTGIPELPREIDETAVFLSERSAFGWGGMPYEVRMEGPQLLAAVNRFGEEILKLSDDQIQQVDFSRILASRHEEEEIQSRILEIMSDMYQEKGTEIRKFLLREALAALKEETRQATFSSVYERFEPFFAQVLAKEQQKASLMPEKRADIQRLVEILRSLIKTGNRERETWNRFRSDDIDEKMKYADAIFQDLNSLAPQHTLVLKGEKIPADFLGGQKTEEEAALGRMGYGDGQILVMAFARIIYQKFVVDAGREDQWLAAVDKDIVGVDRQAPDAARKLREQAKVFFQEDYQSVILKGTLSDRHVVGHNGYGTENTTQTREAFFKDLIPAWTPAATRVDLSLQIQKASSDAILLNVDGLKEWTAPPQKEFTIQKANQAMKQVIHDAIARPRPMDQWTQYDRLMPRAVLGVLKAFEGAPKEASSGQFRRIWDLFVKARKHAAWRAAKRGDEGERTILSSINYAQQYRINDDTLAETQPESGPSSFAGESRYLKDQSRLSEDIRDILQGETGFLQDPDVVRGDDHWTLENTFADGKFTYEQNVILIRTENSLRDPGYHISHARNKDVERVMRYLGVLWDRMSDPRFDWAETLAEFEWLYFQANVLERAGASLGITLSATAQMLRTPGHKPLHAYKRLDVQALGMSLKAYRTQRADELKALERTAVVTGIQDILQPLKEAVQKIVSSDPDTLSAQERHDILESLKKSLLTKDGQIVSVYLRDVYFKSYASDDPKAFPTALRNLIIGLGIWVRDEAGAVHPIGNDWDLVNKITGLWGNFQLLENALEPDMLNGQDLEIIRDSEERITFAAAVPSARILHNTFFPFLDALASMDKVPLALSARQDVYFVDPRGIRTPSVDAVTPAENIEQAMGKEFEKGGIDLNAKALKLSETGTRVNWDAGGDPAMIAKGIDGFVPVVVRITPLTDPVAFFASTSGGAP